MSSPPVLKILVVDDLPDNLELLKVRLETVLPRKTGRPVSVTPVLDAASALAALEEERFDLVITDWKLPGMDGYELTRIIRERGSGGGTPGDVPIITTSVREGGSDRADLHVPKPWNFVEFEAAILRLLEAEPGR